jgi:signal transduction histidine kinase
MAAMGEMIGNIAHQWRQPLSVISTGATGILVKKQYDMLDDKYLESTCEAINSNAQYLSKTIDDFRNFIKGDRDKIKFSIKENINSFLNLVQGSIKTYDIQVITNIEDLTIEGYANELIQCYLNIFNNSKDIFKEKPKDSVKLFFINIYQENDNLIIIFKDNAGGIPLDIIDKIFEPYFTTKHQSQGTGLGLHMTYKMITDGMNGTIEAYNSEYEYESSKYAGAVFKIVIKM